VVDGRGGWDCFDEVGGDGVGPRAYALDYLDGDVFFWRDGRAQQAAPLRELGLSVLNLILTWHFEIPRIDASGVSRRHRLIVGVFYVAHKHAGRLPALRGLGGLARKLSGNGFCWAFV